MLCQAVKKQKDGHLIIRYRGTAGFVTRVHVRTRGVRSNRSPLHRREAGHLRRHVQVVAGCAGQDQ
jgi:hypothetical protein